MSANQGSLFRKPFHSGRTTALGLIVMLAGSMVAPLSVLASVQGEAAKPKVKDSKRPQREEITFRTSVEPQKANPGDTVTFKVFAKLDPEWHIYKYSKTPADSGPKLTSFDLFDTAGLRIEGDWAPSEKPIKIKDEQYPDLDSVEYHENFVEWTIKLEVPKDAKPGKKVLRCQIGYMICKSGKGGICSIPGQWTLEDAVLEVIARDAKPGGETAAVAAPNLVEKPAEKTEVAKSDPPAESKKPDPAPAVSTSKPAPGPAASTAVAATGNVVEDSIAQGLFSFILLSIGAGLSALVMPCVWPMVPITVNFFVKQGHARNGKTLSLAIVYCGAIIVLFTSIGVLFSLVFGATSLQQLAIKWWFNLAIAVMFLGFGLSLLGLFEIGLPNFLLNASAKQESRGGLIGVMFMAVTLTITSFTCTFPVVGGLIVMASTGKFFYPVIGLATFSTVLALPFFLLSLAPGLLAKLPKSGDWMNAVKVVGGLVEIGAAFKFLNNFEIGLGVTPDDAWTGAYTVLTAWIVLAFVCGLYLWVCSAPTTITRL